VGIGAANGAPEGPLISFGLAGALRDDLPVGAVIDATRVVDADGAELWRGEGFGVPGSRAGTILAAETIVDDPDERRRLHDRTGADAADLESGPLARTGRLRGVVRAVSDTPAHPLDGLVGGVTPDGGYNWPGLVRAFLRSPRGFVRSASDARHALDRLVRSWA
jgi:nucleoside phosphorylase